MKGLLLSIVIYLLTTSVSSGSEISSAIVNEVLVGPYYGGKVFIDVSGTPSNIPSCNTSTSGLDYAFDGTTPEGKMYLSIVLTAYASKAEVQLRGEGTCNLQSNVEDLRFIRLK